MSLLLLEEKQFYEARLASGRLTVAAYGTLMRSVEERSEGLAHGRHTLETHDFPFLFEQRLETRWHPVLRLVLPNYMLHWLVRRLEVLLNLEEALQHAAELPFGEVSLGIHREWVHRVHVQIELFYKIYAHYALAVQAFLVADVVLARALNYIGALQASGMVTQPFLVKVRSALHAEHQRGTADAWELLRPSPAYLLARVRPFRLLPRVGLRKAVDLGHRRLLVAGEIACQEGAKKGLFYLVIAGLLESRPSGRRLLPGDAFGEKALLLGEGQAETVTALTTAELLEIGADAFALLLSEFPTLLREQMVAAAPDRA